ncbi:MAG: hypothetical protein ACR2NM_13305 [Bythopirellula sp.]
MAPMKCPAERRPADEFEDSYSLTHLAHRWRVPRKVIKQLLQEGELPFVQVEGQLRVPAASIRKIESCVRDT